MLKDLVPSIIKEKEVFLFGVKLFLCIVTSVFIIAGIIFWHVFIKKTYRN